MRELGVPFVLRWLMWTGVRLGAVANPVRRPGVLRDLPLMLVWAIPAAPFILVVAAVTLPVYLVYKVIEGLAKACGIS
jgi:hypothetical protein